MIDKYAKLKAIAEILEGRVIEDTKRVEVCVKGSVLGFPATLEALRTSFPFGVTYIVEVEGSEVQRSNLNMQILPRYAKGILGFITRILLFESKGQKIGEKNFDSQFISTYNDFSQAERLIKYPGVMEKVNKLNSYTKFNEIGIRVGAGVYLGQPKSFNSLDLDVCRESFRLLGELGQILFESF
ncbi:MAG: hypothetical protein K2Z81_19615 [Cyanobacteria bacterium]|nr:hypothetical protein [Cyanobacteriota bacterium]